MAQRIHFKTPGDLLVYPLVVAISLIAKLTSNFTLLEPDFVGRLMASIYNRGHVSNGILPAPLNRDIARQVIGPGGKYFRMTTENCRVDFIWHDKATNNFLFFGGHKAVIKAMYIINHRIQMCTERNEAQPTVLEEPNADERSTSAYERSTSADERSTTSTDEEPSDDQAYDCFYCLKQSDVRLKKCGNCKNARYCDRECQKADWKNHKGECMENGLDANKRFIPPFHHSILLSSVMMIRNIGVIHNTGFG